MPRNLAVAAALRKCGGATIIPAVRASVPQIEVVMNKSELIQQLADRADLPRSQAQTIVNLLFSPADGLIARSIKKGESVAITGFGTFEQRKCGARTFRNPQTGEPVKAKAAKVPAFRAGATLKATIKGGR